MNSNHYNIDKKLQEMENQSTPDLTQMENHWQHMKSILVNPSQIKSPGRGFLNNPFRLFTLICVTGLTCLIIYEYASSTTIQSNNTNSSPTSNSVTTTQTDTVPAHKKKIAVTQKKDSSTPAVPRKKKVMYKKASLVTKTNDTIIGLATTPTPKSIPNDTILFYSGNKKVATHVHKKLPTTKDTFHLKPMKKKYSTTDTIQLKLDTININTNVLYGKKVKKTINKNNTTSIDSTKNW